MCYRNYSITLCNLNLLIFGICIFGVSFQYLIDIYNDRLSNRNNSDIICGILAVVSFVMILLSLCSIKKVHYDNYGNALV